MSTLYRDAYDAEQFVELVQQPPGVRAVRETNICRISLHRDERTGRAIVFGAIDNLWKGTASEAVQNLNLMFGLPEGDGDRRMTAAYILHSRWVECPDNVTEVGDGLLPRASAPPASPVGSSPTAPGTWR